MIIPYIIFIFFYVVHFAFVFFYPKSYKVDYLEFYGFLLVSFVFPLGLAFINGFTELNLPPEELETLKWAILCHKYSTIIFMLMITLEFSYLYQLYGSGLVNNKWFGFIFFALLIDVLSLFYFISVGIPTDVSDYTPLTVIFMLLVGSSSLISSCYSIYCVYRTYSK